MDINIKKTKCMVFGRKNKTRKSPQNVLNLENSFFHQTELYKYPGLILDENSIYNCHFNMIFKNTNHKVYPLTSLRRHRKYLNKCLNIKHLGRLQFLQNSGLESCLEASKLTSSNPGEHVPKMQGTSPEPTAAGHLWRHMSDPRFAACRGRFPDHIYHIKITLM